MRFVVTRVDSNRVMIRMVPGWLGRLLGHGERTVYAKRGTNLFDLEGWFLSSGRACSREMQDAIDEIDV